MRGADLELLFPKLSTGKWCVKSNSDENYNCIAFAASATNRLWWPSGDPNVYWPPDIPREETIEGFVRAFKTLGYAPCADGRFELGYQKVAIYVDEDKTPQHMARQRFWGSWVSKLGQLEDILHVNLNQLEGHGPFDYGEATHFMKRGLLTAFRIVLSRWAKGAVERLIF